MPVEERHIERFLHVGTVVMMHTDPNRKDGPRHKTIVRGWNKPSHIMVDRPKTETGLFAALQENQNCVMRFLHEGRACAFDTMVLDWDTRRHHPYLRVTWPKSLQFISFRKFERVKVSIPCTVQWQANHATTEHIRDLSIGGCSVTAPRAVGKDAELTLSFELPDGLALANVQAKVRNERQKGERYILGLEFKKGQESVENDLAFYVISVLDRVQGAPPDTRESKRLLVIENNTDLAGKVRHMFERRGWEVLIAYDTADGLSRLRMSSPTAVVVNQHLQDLCGVTVCKVLKGSRDFGRIPVFVYGAEDPALEAEVKEAGGHGFFPQSKTMVPDMVIDLPRLLKIHED